MRDRLVSWVVIAFLAVGCILPACGVMPGTKPQIEPPQLEERVAELENEVAGLRDIILVLKESQDEIVLSHDEFGVILDTVISDNRVCASERQQLLTGLKDAFSTFSVGGGYSPIMADTLNEIAERNNYFYGKLMTVRDFETELATGIEAMHIHGESTDAMIDYIDARLSVLEARLAIEPPPPPS